MKLVMEMDMNLGVIMVKISRMDFFMVADNVHSYSYRLFPVIRKDSFRGQPIFLVPRFATKKTKPEHLTKIEDEMIFFSE